MRKMLRKGAKGFTLIELMIVVAIIGILAAIAIPNFLRFQLKSKSAEGKVNLAAIRTGEESYMAEFGNYVPAAATPAAVPGPQKVVFNTGGFTDFGILGWAPEGSVFFQYAVVVGGPGNLSYTADAIADIDGDSVNQVWGYVKSTTPGNGIAGANCGATLENTVIPCDGVSGQSVF